MMSSPFLQRRHLEAEDRAAVFFCNRHILRDVDQPARQIAGVRVLSAVSARPFRAPWVEMKYFEHRQSFAEVRLDRALDDFTDAARQLLLRLRHQPAHTGELPDWSQRATGCRVEHHDTGIEAALRFRIVATIASAMSLFACVQASITLL